MALLEYFIGFRTRPADLEAFLESQGYVLETRIPKTNDARFVLDGLEAVDIYYYDQIPLQLPQEDPNWSNSGHSIQSELLISSSYSDPNNKAERIRDALVRQYNAIFYDPILRMFFTKEEMFALPKMPVNQ